ncbi:hypothetical protein JTB14_018817 [Gonioctena quinquepunctata]|nr:hypothetical protein JTB14_018817 [Gonioctena quinquepunctata]
MVPNRIFIVLLVVVHQTGSTEKQKYNIGGIFSDQTQTVAFEIATFSMNNKYPVSHIELVPHTSRISPHNTLEAYRATCELLENETIALFGPSSVSCSPFIQALCDSKEIPHIETHRSPNMERNDTLVNLYPHPRVLEIFFMDLIRAFDWKKIIIIYNDEEGLLGIGSLLDFNNGKGETQYVLACSTDDPRKRSPTTSTSWDDDRNIQLSHHQSDLQTLDLEAFQYGGTNITGIRMIDQIELTSEK